MHHAPLVIGGQEERPQERTEQPAAEREPSLSHPAGEARAQRRVARLLDRRSPEIGRLALRRHGSMLHGKAITLASAATNSWPQAPGPPSAPIAATSAADGRSARDR